MIDISLTDFVDYISKAGTSKFTLVNKIYTRGDYEPFKDFWKPLREKIIEIHKLNEDKNELDKLLKNLTDKKKINRYPVLIKSYKSFLGRKEISWFDPPHKDWKIDDLRVRLNPELGLEIDGEFYAIKLYFKADKLSQQKADLILLLLNKQLKKGHFKDVKIGVLDIERKKLYSETKLSDKHLSLLEAEASGFVKVWESLDK